MTEFELIRAFVLVGLAHRRAIAAELGLVGADLTTEDGIKRAFIALKAQGKLSALERALKPTEKPSTPAPPAAQS